MSDLFDPLRSLTEEPVTPVPPSEVRRRGDRQRRRRTAVQVVCGAAAVAAVAVGAGTALDGSTRGASEPPPATQAPSPTPSVTVPAAVTEVPGGFPLERGMVAAEEVRGPGRDALFLPDAVICGGVTGPEADGTTGTTDAVGVSQVGIEHSQNRELRVHADVASARQAADELVDEFRTCASSPGDTVVEVEPRDLGDQGWVVTKGYRFDDLPAIGHEVWLVVRVGNALLVSATIGEGPGLTDPEWFEAAVEEEVARVQRTLRAMCVFAADGCRR